MKNFNSGITLVALVVTVILLLILAGITVTTLFGDEGIINKSQDAADKTNEAQSQEKSDIKDLSGILDDALIPTAKIGKKVNTNTLYANFIAKTDDNQDVKVPIPGGYTVIENTQKSNKINDGIVIQDDLGNEFVWVPVPDANTIYGTDSNGKNWGKLYSFTSTGKSNLNWTEANGVMSISESTGSREPDILSGTDYGDASSTYGIKYLKSAIGITPTAGATDTNQSILDNWMNELENSFNEMIASVKEYKGFYIGRYETGNWASSDSTNIPKVQKGQEEVAYTNWFYQYAETKNLKANDNVVTSMIWGCQFDRTLDWIAETNEGGYSLLTNSSTWGNHKNYKDVTGDTSTTEAGTQVLPSGTNQNWQKNNIFDLAGNVYDWTIEALGKDIRSIRSGYWNGSGSSYPVSMRSGSLVPWSPDSVGRQ